MVLCRHTLEKEMATHSSVLAWRIPWTEKPGRLQSMGSHRVGHDWSDLAAVAGRHTQWQKKKKKLNSLTYTFPAKTKHCNTAFLSSGHTVNLIWVYLVPCFLHFCVLCWWFCYLKWYPGGVLSSLPWSKKIALCLTEKMCVKTTLFRHELLVLLTTNSILISILLNEVFLNRNAHITRLCTDLCSCCEMPAVGAAVWYSLNPCLRDSYRT